MIAEFPWYLWAYWALLGVWAALTIAWLVIGFVKQRGPIFGRK